MNAYQLVFTFALPVFTSNVVFAEAQCPAGVTPVRYHSLGLSQIGTAVFVNHSGPYEFLVDTGAQITIIEPSLAEELQLKPQASIGVISVSKYAKASLTIPELVEAGGASAKQPLVAIQALGQIQHGNPQIRGILGETFLARFDLLIDYVHKSLCLDGTRNMQQQMTGEHMPLLEQQGRQSDLPYTQPVLISVHLRGDGAKGTILRLDSGTNAPVLFAGRQERPEWMMRNSGTRGSVAGNGTGITLAITPAQEVKFGSHVVRQIAFFTPVGPGETLAGAGGEDGLLPTSLFKRVFISYVDGFAILDPK